MRFKCSKCGRVENHSTQDDAEAEGWDILSEHTMLCGNCPQSSLIDLLKKP